MYISRDICSIYICIHYIGIYYSSIVQAYKGSTSENSTYGEYIGYGTLPLGIDSRLEKRHCWGRHKYWVVHWFTPVKQVGHSKSRTWKAFLRWKLFTFLWEFTSDTTARIWFDLCDKCCHFEMYVPNHSVSACPNLISSQHW